MKFYTLKWQNGAVSMIDQRKLPTEETYNTYTQVKEVAQAIKTMVVRGAPAIGVAGAFGMALASQNSQVESLEDFQKEMNQAAALLISQRPTAVNLPWAVKKIQSLLNQELNLESLKKKIFETALAIYAEDVAMCEAMGRFGAELIKEGKTYLTHCNAGALATAGQGTALSVFYEAAKQGKKFSVIASETRPFLQGARLTAWELEKNGIDVTLITDNMVAHLMKLGKIQGVVTGSDRIAANGDVANKIGTYGAALLAKAHDIPFYVVAPYSTVDFDTASGEEIPIEERPREEIVQFFGEPCAPEKIKVLNPAFDVTPAKLVSAIVTERGMVKQPYEINLRNKLTC